MITHLHVARGRLVRPLAAVAAAVLLGAACTVATTTPAAPSAATATAAATAAPGPLTIGVIVPYTESAVNDDIGVAQKRAAELYLGRHGGMLGGHAVKLVFSDESIDGGVDTTKAMELVENQHADLLVGLVGNDGAYAVRRYADQKHIVFIDTSASGNALTRTTPGCTPSCTSRYVFRTSFTNWQLSEPLGEWAAHGGRTAFFLAYADDTFGVESADAFGEGLVKAGGRATGRDAVAAGGDWTKVMAAIRAQPTKDVFAAFAGADAEGFIGAWAKQHMGDAGYRLVGPGLLTDSAVLAKVKGEADAITTGLFWSSTLANAEDRTLVELFPKTYADEDGNPSPADAATAEMWDTMIALDGALGASASFSTDGLVGALEHVHVAGARGAFTFDPATHNVVQDVYVRVVRTTGGTAANAVIDTLKAVADPGR